MTELSPMGPGTLPTRLSDRPEPGQVHVRVADLTGPKR